MALKTVSSVELVGRNTSQASCGVARSAEIGPYIFAQEAKTLNSDSIVQLVGRGTIQTAILVTFAAIGPDIFTEEASLIGRVVNIGIGAVKASNIIASIAAYLFKITRVA